MFDRKMFPSIGADDSLGCSSNAIHPVKLVGLHWGGIKKKINLAPAIYIYICLIEKCSPPLVLMILLDVLLMQFILSNWLDYIGEE
jgi:hypothetical protein